jgi:hypothetical protein
VCGGRDGHLDRGLRLLHNRHVYYIDPKGSIDHF